MNLYVLASAAGAEAAGEGFAAYIAAGITAAVFIISAVVLRSFRDVAHRSDDVTASAAEHH